MNDLKTKIKSFPNTPGVYVMKNARSEVVYIGKATSLKERVLSYFASNLTLKTTSQMQNVADIEYIECESALEALVLESRLIKKHLPKFNIKEKDDKSRAYIYISKEKFPRVQIIRGTDLYRLKLLKNNLFGPFGSTKIVSQALEIIRKIVPFRTCRVMPQKKCLYGYLGLCDSPCEKKVSAGEYMDSIKNVKSFLNGKKNRLQKSLEKQLSVLSKQLKFEEAAKVRDRIYALEHLKQIYVTSDSIQSIYDRIEGYDISNISGEFATGSMVVFINGTSEKSEYRKFKIRSTGKANDVEMMAEVIQRRFQKKTDGWQIPDLLVIDGGRPQVNGVLRILRRYNLKIPVVGLAKGIDRKKDEIIGSQTFPRDEVAIIKQVRDEAHRFAKNYYQKLHRKSQIKTSKDIMR